MLRLKRGARLFALEYSMASISSSEWSFIRKRSTAATGSKRYWSKKYGNWCEEGGYAERRTNLQKLFHNAGKRTGNKIVETCGKYKFYLQNHTQNIAFLLNIFKKGLSAFTTRLNKKLCKVNKWARQACKTRHSRWWFLTVV